MRKREIERERLIECEKEGNSERVIECVGETCVRETERVRGGVIDRYSL